MPSRSRRRIGAIADYRSSRNQRIVERLNELGYAIEWEDVARRAQGRVGRPHIAAALVDAGHVRDPQEAFDRLLADGQPAYVDAGSLGPEEAVEVVAASGGAAVLAHPYTLRMTEAELERFAAGLVGHGLRGIECFRPDHDEEQRAFTLRVVRAARARAGRRIRLARAPRRARAGRRGPGAASGGHARAPRLA